MAKGKKKRAKRNIAENNDKRKLKVKTEPASNSIDQSGYLSMISHEVRTPLATIFSSVDLIQRINRSDEPDKNIARERIKSHALKIKNSVFRAIELLDNIMAVNSLESRQNANACDVVHIRTFITGIIDKAKANFESVPVININYKTGIESCLADKKLMDLVYTNLVSNAIKFSGESASINISISLSDSTLIFEITDKGIGIPENNKEHLYEPFFRGNNAGDIAGNGLGMYIVKKAVDLLNGQISLKSKVNSGTKFIVKIPVNRSFKSH